MNLEACLPVALQRPTTKITKIAAGLSGAGVYQVEAEGEAFVLKISSGDEPLSHWREKLQLRQLAASAGLAPRVLHTDEARRALVSDFIVDRSFMALYAAPHTRKEALTKLGQTLRRVHSLPLPKEAHGREPREFLSDIWSKLAAASLPVFVREAVRKILAEEAPPLEHGVVLSHNDINPTNLVYDGERLLLLDWETSGPNDPFYDLASISVFLRMDEDTCRALLSAYDGEPTSALSARFLYSRRLVATLCGAVLLHLAHQSGHPGAKGGETIEATLSLGEFYQQLRAGALNPATNEGKWAFGLAMLKEGAAL